MVRWAFAWWACSLLRFGSDFVFAVRGVFIRECGLFLRFVVVERWREVFDGQ